MIDAACQNSCAITLFQKEQSQERIVDRDRFNQRELENIVTSLISQNCLDRYEFYERQEFKHVSSLVIDQIKRLIPQVITLFNIF